MSDGYSPQKMREIAAVIIPFAMKAKLQMLNAKTTRARKTCPNCGGTVHFVLAGSRNHMHMACENIACFMRMME